MANPFNPDDDMDDAPCCGDPDIIDEDGQSVCRNCGMVHGNAFVSIEKRAYTA